MHLFFYLFNLKDRKQIGLANSKITENQYKIFEIKLHYESVHNSLSKRIIIIVVIDKSKNPQNATQIIEM